MEYKCQFCNKIFTQKSNLNTHIKTAKKCILNRSNDLEKVITFNCDFCDKKFTQKNVLNVHLNSCNQYKLYNQEKEYKNIILEKDKNIEELLRKNDEIKSFYLEKIQDLKDTILRLEETNKELALKAIERPTNITNNKSDNHSINNNTYNNLQPVNLSPDYIYQVFDQNLKLEDIYQGQRGLANIVANKLLKDESGKPIAFCNDKSRQIIKYKNEDNQIVKDSKAYNLISSIAPVAQKIALKRKQEFESIYYPEKKEEVNEEDDELLLDESDEENEDDEELLLDEDELEINEKIKDMKKENNDEKKKEKAQSIIQKIQNNEGWTEDKKTFYYNKMITGVVDLQCINVNSTIFSKQLSMILPSENKVL
jgi:hypothetical protein